MMREEIREIEHVRPEEPSVGELFGRIREAVIVTGLSVIPMAR